MERLIILAIVIAAFALSGFHEEPEVFPLDPEISCTYSGAEGEVKFSIINNLDSNLSIAHVRIFDAPTATNMVLVLNGRLIEPDEYCNTNVVPVWEALECSIPFNPEQYKSGIFRMFQFIDKNIVTKSGDKVSNVIRLRILDKGSKYRENFEFDCVEG